MKLIHCTTTKIQGIKLTSIACFGGRTHPIPSMQTHVSILPSLRVVQNVHHFLTRCLWCINTNLMYLLVSYVKFTNGTHSEVCFNTYKESNTKKTASKHEASTLVPQPCFVKMFWVHVWAHNHDRVETSLVHANPRSSLSPSLSLQYNQQ